MRSSKWYAARVIAEVGRMAPAKSEIPVIDMSPLFHRGMTAERAAGAQQIELACRDTGFFYVRGHRIPVPLTRELDAVSRRFFALPEEKKSEIAMTHGGRAWRGYFPVG